MQEEQKTMTQSERQQWRDKLLNETHETHGTPCDYCGSPLDKKYNMHCLCSVDNSHGYHAEYQNGTWIVVKNTYEYANRK